MRAKGKRVQAVAGSEFAIRQTWARVSVRPLHIMRIFRRLFGQKSKCRVPGKFVLRSNVTIETRGARVDTELATAIRRTCQEIPELAACYLLDARKPETGETVLIIATTIDEPTRMDSVAERFQTMLRQFPFQASKTYIMSANNFTDDYAGAEFYLRPTA